MDAITDCPFESTAAGRHALTLFIGAHLAALPDKPRAALIEATGNSSAPTQFRDITEALYAAVKAEGDGAMVGEERAAAAHLAGRFANHVRTWWSTLRTDDRGTKILNAMQREVGETNGPDPADDPPVAERFAPPVSQVDTSAEEDPQP